MFYCLLFEGLRQQQLVVRAGANLVSFQTVVPMPQYPSFVGGKLSDRYAQAQGTLVR